MNQDMLHDLLLLTGVKTALQTIFAQVEVSLASNSYPSFTVSEAGVTQGFTLVPLNSRFTHMVLQTPLFTEAAVNDPENWLKVLDLQNSKITFKCVGNAEAVYLCAELTREETSDPDMICKHVIWLLQAAQPFFREENACAGCETIPEDAEAEQTFKVMMERLTRDT